MGSIYFPGVRACYDPVNSMCLLLPYVFREPACDRSVMGHHGPMSMLTLSLLFGSEVKIDKQ